MINKFPYDLFFYKSVISVKILLLPNLVTYCHITCSKRHRTPCSHFFNLWKGANDLFETIRMNFTMIIRKICYLCYHCSTYLDSLLYNWWNWQLGHETQTLSHTSFASNVDIGFTLLVEFHSSYFFWNEYFWCYYYHVMVLSLNSTIKHAWLAMCIYKKKTLFS